MHIVPHTVHIVPHTIEISPEQSARLHQLLALDDAQWRALVDLAESQLQLEALSAAPWTADDVLRMLPKAIRISASDREALDTVEDDVVLELTAADLRSMLATETRRSEDKRTVAAWRCDQRTRERDTAVTVAERMAIPAEIGRAVLAVIEQVERLRALNADTMPFGIGPSDVAAAIVAEVDEVEREPPGSRAAQSETADVLAAALHLTITHDVDLVRGMEEWATRMRRRLDAVADGATWSEAKRLASM